MNRAIRTPNPHRPVLNRLFLVVIITSLSFSILYGQQESIPCNEETPWVPPTFDVSEEHSTTGAAAWTNPGRVVDTDLTNFAVASVGAIIGGSATLSVSDDLGNDYMSGDFAGFRFAATSILGLGINTTTTIRTRLGNTIQESHTFGSLVNLQIGVSEAVILGFMTTEDFDEVEITFSTTLGTTQTFNVYYAVVESYCDPGPDLVCNVLTPLNRDVFPARIDYLNTGSGGVTIGSVDNAADAVSASTSDYASLINLTGVAGSTFIAVYDGATNYPPGTFVGFDIENTALLGLGLFSTLSLTSYHNGDPMQTVTGNALLLNAPLLEANGRQTVGFITQDSVDEVKLTITQSGVNLGTTRVYSAIFQTFCAGPELPCNEPTALYSPDYPVYINTANSGFTGACVGCSLDDPDHLIDDDPDSFAEIEILADAVGTGSISVGNGYDEYPANTFAGFHIENVNLVDANVLTGITISTYLNGNFVEDADLADGLVSVNSGLLVNTGEQFVGFVTSAAFDEVQISLTNVGLFDIGTTRIYDVLIGEFCEADVECDTTYFLNTSDFPVYVDYLLTGFDDNVCVLCEVEDPHEVITESNADYATISVPVAALGDASIAVRDALYVYPPGTIAGFVIDDTNTLLQADLFASITITTYLDGEEQESETAGNLIDAELLVLFINSDAGVHNVGFETSLPFDEIQISVGNLVSLLNMINVYGAFVDTRNSDGGSGDLQCAENNPPLAVYDINNTPQDEPASGNVLTNDEDPDGDNLTVNPVPLDDPDNGTVVLNPDGSYTYTPDPGFTGEDQFTYEVCDDGTPSLCDTAVVYIEVIGNPDGDNRPPVANPDANQTEEDTPVNGDLLSNDSDPDGDNLIVNTTPVDDPDNGTVVINPDGTYTYTPDPGFTGQDVFTYEVCDDGTPSLCDIAIVVIDVLPDVGNSTFANDDAGVTDVNTPVSGNVSDNDFDPEGDDQSVNTTLVTDATNGTVVLAADGSYTYTPDADFVGNDFFAYETCDDATPPACDIATVYIAVLPHNNPPLAVDDINNTPQDEPANGNVLTNDEDPDGDDLTVNPVPLDPPDNGGVTLNPDGSYTYTPNPGFTGEDQFTYEVCDDGTPSLCDTAVVYIEVIPNPDGDNRPPVANPDANQTEEDTPVNGDLLSNDSDPDGDNLIVNTTPVDDPDNGSVVINPDGTYTYTPDPGFTGQDVFTYEVCDDGTPSLCDIAIVVIDVLPGADNNTFANDDAAVTDINTPVSGNVSDNDFDPEGDDQTVNTTPVTDAANGTVVLAADGSYTYTPDANFVGNDFFTYETCDDGTPPACDIATVYIAVLPANTGPIAVDDTATTDEDTSVDIDVLDNDSDPDGPLTMPDVVQDPAHGTVEVNGDSTITYTPFEDFVGVDTFTYALCDDVSPLICDTATVIVTVLPQTDTVIVTIPEDSMITFCADSLTTFVGDAVSFDECEPPSNGSTAPNGTCLTYTPTLDWSGVDEFCVVACDGNDICDTTIIIVNVICPSVAIQVFLEGPLDSNANLMSTYLNDYHILPGQNPDSSSNLGSQLVGVAAPPGQPYDGIPWLWMGAEGDDYGDEPADIEYPPTVTDWVLISAREGDSSLASEVWKCAALLHNDGTAEFPEDCQCAHQLQNGSTYYIVVEHRNHLPIMSNKITMAGNVLSIDFTQSQSWVFIHPIIGPLGYGQKLIGGDYAMYAANSEQTSARNDINASDDGQWLIDNGSIFKYRRGDHNLDGDSNATDEFIWLVNNSRFTLIPF